MAIGFTAGEEVSGEIRKRIVTGRLPPESVISREFLYENFHLDELAIDSVINGLVAKGLIESGEHKIVTSPLEEPALGMLVAVRGQLEERAIRHGLSNSSIGLDRKPRNIFLDNWHELYGALSAAARAGSIEEICEVDYLIHQNTID